MTIDVCIKDKIATVRGHPVIVCGNSDYVLRFAFDAEWDAYRAKTALFEWYSGGEFHHKDVLFSGDTVPVPVLYNTGGVTVCVTAGDIRTAAPAWIRCIRSLTELPPDAAPDLDLWHQIMEYLASLQDRMHHCGEVADTAALPHDAADGDTYRVTADGMTYTWYDAAKQWLPLSPDLSAYATAEEVAALRDKVNELEQSGGIGNGVLLVTAPTNGETELSVVISGTEYDAANMVINEN